jgi:NTP pyrophosphatase (non-canonical NTP hydrolase)
MQLRATQHAVWDNKVSKGFNTTDVPLEICLLQGEIAELFDAWRHKDKTEIGEELADVAIYLLGLAQMLKVDLEAEIHRKMEINYKRRYVRKGGVLVKDGKTASGGGAGGDRHLSVVESPDENMLF